MTKHKGIRLLSLAIAFVFLCSSALTTLVSTNVSANVQNLDSLYYTEDLYNQVSKRQHYWWLYGCMRNADITNLNASQLNSWDFFEGNQATGGNDQESALGHMYDINGSTVPCANQDVVKTAAAYLGKTDPKAFFCGLQGSVGLDATMIQQVNCTGTNPAIWTNTASGSQLAADYKTDVGGEPANTRAMQYMRAYASLMQGCQVTFTNAETYDTANAARGSSTDSTIIGVPVIVKNDRDIFVKKYKTGKIGNLSNALILVGNSSASDTPWTTTGCTELRNIADDMALDYQIYLTTNKDKVISSVAGPDSTPGTTSGGEPTCEVSGFGWVICPLINMFAEVTNTVAEFLDDYLKIEPLTFDTDSALYKGWSSLLGVANVLLILAILAIVFSQATSLGISNYGVKKMLPKVVAAAILINISYFICAVLVDISNIVGAGIADLITGTIGGAGNTGGSTGIAGGIRSFTDAILGGIFAVSGIVVVAFFFLIPAVISILTIFIVIAVRSAIITLLIILSPLAFAAWVLPNTEKYFKKWLDLFTQMLVIYPAIMAIFAASTVAASIVVSTGSDVSIQDNPGPGNFFPLLIGLLIQALPLLALPALIKGTSSVLGRIESATRGQIKKYGGDAADARVQGMKKIGMAAAAQRFDREYSPGGANRFTRGSKTALGRAVGIAARAPQRRALWEQRVGNAEQQQKTLLAEHAASNPQSRAARTVDTTKDLAERGDVADKTQKRRYEESRVFGATPNERGARAIESATLDNELRNAEEVKKRAFNATAIQAPGGRANQSVLEGKAIGLETKAQEEALDERFKRQRNAAISAPAGTAPGAVLPSGAIVTDTGLRAAASETQSKTNEIQLKNLDGEFQKTYDQGILNVRSGTAAPAWATTAEAATTGAASAKDDQDAVAKKVEQTYEDIVNSGIQGVAPSAAAAAAGAARRNLEQSTLGATNAAGRVKSTLTTQGAGGFDTTLQGLQQDAIEVGKTQKLADERVQETYKQGIVSNPSSTRAELEKELTDVAKEGEQADAQIKDQYAQDVLNNVNNRGGLERETESAKETLGNREIEIKNVRKRQAVNDPTSDAATNAAAKMDLEEEGSNLDLDLSGKRKELAATDPTSTAAINAERKYQLGERMVGATAAQNLNIADRVATDAAFTQEAAGIRGERDEARIRGAAMSLVAEDRAKEVEIHAGMQGRNSALFTTSGIGYDGGNFITTHDVPDPDDPTGTSTIPAGTIIGDPDIVSKIVNMPVGALEDRATLSELEYTTKNGLTDSNAGVRSIIRTLAKNRALKSTHIEKLIKDYTVAYKAANGKDVDPEEIAYIIEAANSDARSEGLKHLSYNDVDTSGNVRVGERFGGPEGVADRILKDGVSSITKEMYTDPQFGPLLAQRVHDLQTSQPKSFEAELTKMIPLQIENLVAAEIQAGIIPYPFDTVDTSGAPLSPAVIEANRIAAIKKASKKAQDDYTNLQAKAKKEFGST